MTWTLVLLLGASAYALKALGAVVIGDRAVPPALQRCLLLIPAALLAALITKDTFTSGQEIVVDARLVGLAVAAVLSWRRAPFALTVFAGVGATALLRLVA
ncbi:MAG: AzlD domain-containing protein [Actinobacteria bacterium]|nr:AzlD domain-containing protein [Actinomycetota bacterium]NBR65680.1 AzlD domain-containing protein [Actinomycetota bacterium]NBU16258.1 AzlD domain-containing protein [Actinomycetota bacterium]NCW46220.1 AzlD domain-containing protein [Gemmatimonadaceae bacterium]